MNRSASSPSRCQSRDPAPAGSGPLSFCAVSPWGQCDSDKNGCILPLDQHSAMIRNTATHALRSPLPGSFYRDAAMLDQLRERVFSPLAMGLWSGRDCPRQDMSGRSTCCPASWMNPLLATASEQNEPLILANVCTHRGNLLTRAAGPAVTWSALSRSPVLTRRHVHHPTRPGEPFLIFQVREDHLDGRHRPPGRGLPFCPHAGWSGLTPGSIPPPAHRFSAPACPDPRP